MTAKTPAERKAAERQRRADAGLKELRGVWVRPEDEEAVKRYAERLSGRYNEVILGSQPSKQGKPR